MELEMEFEPIYYEPILNQDGFYIDCLDEYRDEYTFVNGITCRCGSKKDHIIMKNVNSLRQHMKSKKHQKWLEEINCNLPNYYQECIRLREQINALQQNNQHLTYLLQQKDYHIHYLENMNINYIHS